MGGGRTGNGDVIAGLIDRVDQAVARVDSFFLNKRDGVRSRLAKPAAISPMPSRPRVPGSGIAVTVALLATPLATPRPGRPSKTGIRGYSIPPSSKHNG